MRRITMVLLTAVTLPMAAHVIADTEWPTQNVTLVVHQSPGGGNELMVRQLGATLQRQFGIRTVVDHRVGGSSAVALSWMANNAPNDGSTILAVTPTQLITPIRSPGIPTYEDLTPIARLMMDPTTLFVHRNSPFETLDDLVEYARENPRSLSVGIGSAGALDQLVLQNLIAEAGIDVRTVPHEGGGDAVVSLLGEHIDAALGEPGKTLAHLESGNIRMLAVFQEERLDDYPDIPTAREMGYDIVSTKFRGFFGPPDMDPQLVEAIGNTLRDIQDEEPWKTYWTESSMMPAFLGHEDFVSFLHENNREMREFVESLQ